MESIFVIAGTRTPTLRRDSAVAKIHPAALGVTVLQEVVKRAQIDSAFIDMIKLACATQTAEQGLNIGRTIAYKAFGPNMPASTVNMLCGSSAEAICDSWGRIASGQSEIIIACGVENNHLVFQGQDLVPFLGNIKNFFKLIKHGIKIVNFSLPEGYVLHPMGISGDAIAKKYGFSREVVDKFAFESQMKAAKAMYDGKFDEEIVQLHTSSGIVLRDESIRPNTSLSGLSKLKPAFGSDGIHTAGSSSQISAGAAAVLLASESAVKKHNLKPIARLVASSVVATDSQKAEEQLIGPKFAIKKVLEKAKLKIEDIDLFEINEAFASVVLATIQECKINPEKVNVNGGAIALGHPLGVSGARLPVTLLHEMQKRAKEGKPSKYGLVTLCIGGGQAIAIIFERV